MKMKREMHLTRRAFLRLTAGNSLAVAVGGLGTQCPAQFPGNWISEPLPPVQNIKPVELIRYATTCRECPAGCGMHVRHVNGRSLKAEGNPDHPVNRGGLCARGQSALQGLYDPDRLRRPLSRNRPAGAFPDLGVSPVSWEDALREIGNRLRTQKGRTVVISGLETGAKATIMENFAKGFEGRLLLYEPFDYRPLRETSKMAVGAPVIPRYDLERCRTILSFTADFLESWVSNVEFTWMFTRMHEHANGRMGTFAYIGPRQSMTAANADEFLQVPPQDVYNVAMNILKVMADRDWVRDRELDYKTMTRGSRPEDLPLHEAAARIEKLAEHFAREGDSVALTGPQCGPGKGARQLAEAVFLLNRAAGNFGRTIDFGRVHALSGTVYQEELTRLAEGLTGDDTIIFHETNPIYVQPELAARFRQAGTIVSLTQLADETARLADFILPVDNPLESWGEYSPWTGIRGFIQPTMKRLYDSRAAGDIFLSLADIGGRPLTRPGSEGRDLDFVSWMRADWQEQLTAGDEEPSRGISRFLRQGFNRDLRREEAVEVSVDRIQPVPPQPPAKSGADSAELWLWPSIFLFDGRTANRGWLQENPHPVSQIVWGSWADIHPAKAAALGIVHGDGLRIVAGKTEVQVPARLTEEIAEEVVGLALGQGHWALGSVAAGLGANGFALLYHGGETFGRVTIGRVKGLGPPISLTASREQHKREILRWEKLAKIKAGHMEAPKIDLPVPEGFAKKYDLYRGHEHAGHRWAMVIDLHRCIGCGACAVACYAENNIPILGPGPLRDWRGLGWLQVVPYSHPEKKDTIGFLPLPCQHCDQAPCEPVCPVFASVHTEDGLNAQVYNRCIGTRYCSQNCPYKVRKFNWLNSSFRPPLQWQLNPEVTVRSRGVMEKCTFCVQRIRHAEYRAKREDRQVRDGEILPACVQSCPAKVFTFGDLHDEKSAVSRLFREDPRGYQLLHELNTKPAVLYLKKIEHG